MRCRNCGTQFDRRDGSCPWCGTEVFGTKAKTKPKAKSADPWEQPSRSTWQEPSKSKWDSQEKSSWNHDGACANEAHENMRVIREQRAAQSTGSYNMFAVGGFIFAMLSIWFNLGIFSILGIVQCSKARKQIRATGERGWGLTTAGLVISWLTLIFFLLMIGMVGFIIWLNYALPSGIY